MIFVYILMFKTLLHEQLATVSPDGDIVIEGTANKILFHYHFSLSHVGQNVQLSVFDGRRDVSLAAGDRSCRG